MSDKKTCKRCGADTPVYDFERDTTTYYGFQRKTETTTTVKRSIRLIIWTIYGSASKRAQQGRSPILQADDEVPLCDDCGGLLIGRFMQGRSVPAMPGKEKW